MKKILMILSMVGVVLLSSCAFDHGDIKVNPGISFNQTGLTKVSTISIYEEQVQNVTIARTTGLSQEFTVDIAVDPALIDAYNETYSADYQLMPANVYSLPAQIEYAQFARTANIPVTFNTALLVQQVGLANAGKYVIPVRLTDTSIPADYAPNKVEVLLVLDIAEPSVTVGTGLNADLNFISGVPIAQTVTIDATTNFTTLDVTKVSYAADPSKVAVFNAANGTSHIILPSGTYTIHQGTFNAATKSLELDVDFNCSSLSIDDTYLLPLVLTNTASYQMIQDEVVYVEVAITELKLTIQYGGTLQVSTSGTGNFRASINAPIEDPEPIVFEYDAAAIAAYNSANGTSLVAYPSNKVTIPSTAIAAGSLFVNVGYTIDISDLEYDSTDEYAVAFTLNQTSLVAGTNIIGSTTVIFKLKKTVIGWYDRTLFDAESYYINLVADGQNNGDYSGTIQNYNVVLNETSLPNYPGNDSGLMEYCADKGGETGAGGRLRPNVPLSSSGQPLGKYAIYTYALGGGNYFFFDITNRPSAVKGSPWVELDMYQYSWFDGLYEHKSAFNPVTGQFWFDILAYAYWNDPTRFSLTYQNRRDA